MKLLLALLFILPLTVNASSTGTLQLRGTIGVVYDILVTPDGTNNVSLNILAGETNKSVANVSETSNNTLGYKIKASSASGGFLVHTVDNTKKTAYQIVYGSGSATTLTTPGVYVKSVTSLSGLTTQTSNVKANVTALPLGIAGTYEDLVTLTIEAP